MNDALLYQLTGVHKSYGHLFSLHIENLSINAGDCLCLLGPTGAGKSTLLRILAGLEHPNSGDVVLDGHNMFRGTLPQSIRQRITMVFQKPLLLRGTVRENVEYAVRFRNVPHSYLVEMDNLLERFGLCRMATQSAQTLSSGQTQLVALARALAVQPDVLILDEPTANLDPAHVALVERIVGEDYGRRGTTVVWATHNLFQARRMATHVGLLLDGRIIELASVDAFFDSPSEQRTLDFIQGKMIY